MPDQIYDTKIDNKCITGVVKMGVMGLQHMKPEYRQYFFFFFFLTWASHAQGQGKFKNALIMFQLCGNKLKEWVEWGRNINTKTIQGHERSKITSDF